MKNIYFQLFVLIVVLLSGCQTQQTTNVLDPNQKKDNSEILVFTSDKLFTEDQQTEVLVSLKDALDSGKYNVLTIETVYTNVHLTSAKIKYDLTSTGKGNNLRVMFLTSNRISAESMQNDVLKKLEDFYKTNTKEIVNIQETKFGEFTIAVEIYYYK